MKLVIKKLNRAGNALLVCMMATAIVGIMLAAYITLIKSQTQSVARSQTWNTTVSLVEAGMEEAMAHLNLHGTTNLLCEPGWYQVGSKYVIQRTLGDGYYNVSIDNWLANTSCTPVVEARAFVTPPVLVASAASAGPFVAAANVEMTPTAKLGRGIKATVGIDALFAKGLVAKGQIDMNGNNIQTDSFDSLSTSYSTAGKYDSGKRRQNGDVATNSTLTNSVNVGNADIYGSVSTGPHGTVSIGSQGFVTGGTKDDMNVSFPDVTVPFAGGGYNTPGSGTVGGVSYAYVLSGGNWKLSSLSLGGQQKLIAVGNNALWITGTLGMSGQAQIEIPAGSSLTIYAGGAVSIGGNGVINPGDATRFILYGLSTCTSISVSGNGGFTGCLYAPYADFSMSGGGNNTTDFQGASITKTVTMNGHFNFHYDEALRKRGPSRGWLITSWNEMSPTEVANVPVRTTTGN